MSAANTCCEKCFADEPQIGTSGPKWCALNGLCPCHSRKTVDDIVRELRGLPLPSPELEELLAEFVRGSLNTLLDQIEGEIAAGKFPEGTPAEWEAGHTQAKDEDIQIIRSRRGV